MKFLIYTDVHFNEYSSIIRTHGEKYSTRLEALIKSVDWAENLAEEYNCDEIITLGDFFNAPDLNSREITALQDIKWAQLPHTFLVGNHDASVKSLKYNSAAVLKKNGFNVIDKPTIRSILDKSAKIHKLLFLPYITDNSDIKLSNYLSDLKNEFIIIFSHNDIKGINYGIIESKLGFDINEIDTTPCLMLNGHLHNGSKFCNNGLNLGNLTGQNFKEDAFNYKHQAAILDTETKELIFVENPYAFNFYQIEINDLKDLKILDTIKNNAVLSLKCNENIKPKLEEYLEIVKTRIIEKRILITREHNTAESTIDSLQDLSMNHLDKFMQCCRENITNDAILEFELSEVCK